MFTLFFHAFCSVKPCICSKYRPTLFPPIFRLEKSYSDVNFGKGGWTEFIKFFKATPQEAQELINMMTGGKDAEASNGVPGSEEAEDRNSRFDSLYDE